MDLTSITLHIFLEMLVEWIGEFYIISTLMSFKLEKRSHFLLRYILGLALIIAISYPISIFYHFYGEDVLGRSLVYLVLFALAVAHHIFCYKEQILKTLLFSDMAYLTQNAIYKIFLITWTILNYNGVFGIYGPSELTYKLIYYSCFIFWTALGYFVYFRRMNKNVAKLVLPGLIITITIVTILVSNVICSTFDIHFALAVQDIDPSHRLSVFLAELSSDLLTFLLDVSVIVMFFAYIRRINSMENIAKMEYVIAQSEEQYKISQETIESINIKCHDMRHKVNKIVGDNLSKETLEEVNEVISVYDSLIDTGNKTLDVILIEKSLLCDNNKISFTKLVDGSSLSFLSTGDMFCLFGNILDNAIEATKNLEDKNKRYINLTVKKVGEGIIDIECQNYYDGNIEFENNLPKTLKSDKTSHGFGVKSIRNLVKKYNGSMNIEAKNNLFVLHIIIFDNIQLSKNNAD